jgi:hypothetical protein
MPERKDVTIHSESAVAYFSARGRSMLYDPDRPKVDPNQLYAELGSMTDPRLVNHNCPICHKTMQWDLFVAHAEGCMRRWYHTLDVAHRKFRGATPEAPDASTP